MINRREAIVGGIAAGVACLAPSSSTKANPEESKIVFTVGKIRSREDSILLVYAEEFVDRIFGHMKINFLDKRHIEKHLEIFDDPMVFKQRCLGWYGWIDTKIPKRRAHPLSANDDYPVKRGSFYDIATCIQIPIQRLYPNKDLTGRVTYEEYYPILNKFMDITLSIYKKKLSGQSLKF